MPRPTPGQSVPLALANRTPVRASRSWIVPSLGVRRRGRAAVRAGRPRVRRRRPDATVRRIRVARHGTTATVISFSVTYRNREGSPVDWVRVKVAGAAHAMHQRDRLEGRRPPHLVRQTAGRHARRHLRGDEPRPVHRHPQRRLGDDHGPAGPEAHAETDPQADPEARRHAPPDRPTHARADGPTRPPPRRSADVDAAARHRRPSALRPRPRPRRRRRRPKHPRATPPSASARRRRWLTQRSHDASGRRSRQSRWEREPRPGPVTAPMAPPGLSFGDGALDSVRPVLPLGLVATLVTTTGLVGRRHGASGCSASAVATASHPTPMRSSPPPPPGASPWPVPARTASRIPRRPMPPQPRRPCSLDPEMAMPRWRRPSLLEARKADPLRDATAAPRLTFDQGLVGPLDGRERRLIRYNVVRLLDAPTSSAAPRSAFLDQGDEVQLLETPGRVLAGPVPGRRQGWIHKMTLGEIVRTTSSVPNGADGHDADRGRYLDDGRRRRRRRPRRPTSSRANAATDRRRRRSWRSTRMCWWAMFGTKARG